MSAEIDTHPGDRLRELAIELRELRKDPRVPGDVDAKLADYQVDLDRIGRELEIDEHEAIEITSTARAQDELRLVGGQQ